MNTAVSSIVNFHSHECCANEMVSRPALHKHGGQAPDLLTITLKTDSNKPKAEIYWILYFPLQPVVSHGCPTAK
jgi:hypothetical protein